MGCKYKLKIAPCAIIGLGHYVAGLYKGNLNNSAANCDTSKKIDSHCPLYRMDWVGSALLSGLMGAVGQFSVLFPGWLLATSGPVKLLGFQGAFIRS